MGKVEAVDREQSIDIGCRRRGYLIESVDEEWDGFGSVEELAKKNAIIDVWCAVEGTDPSKIERTTLQNASPDVDLDALASAGIQHVILALGSPFDLTAVETVLAKARG